MDINVEASRSHEIVERTTFHEQLDRKVEASGSHEKVE